MTDQRTFMTVVGASLFAPADGRGAAAREHSPQLRARALREGTNLVAVVLIAVVALAACQSIADVAPGPGRRATIEGHPYDQVWNAALKVASTHFRIVEQSKQDGIIRAEQEGTGGGWIGIYLTGTQASGFTVEVVKKARFVGSWQDWEQRVLREIQDTLAQQPSK